MQYGAIVDALDSQQHTPLFRASELGHSEVVKKLLQGFFSQYCIDFFLVISLDETRGTLHLNVFSHFAAHASIDLQDADGRCAMHWSVGNTIAIALCHSQLPCLMHPLGPLLEHLGITGSGPHWEASILSACNS